LGVWVVREGTKYMLNNLVEKFDNYNELIKYLSNKFMNKYNVSVYKLRKYSNLLSQKSIFNFI